MQAYDWRRCANAAVLGRDARLQLGHRARPTGEHQPARTGEAEQAVRIAADRPAAVAAGHAFNQSVQMPQRASARRCVGVRGRWSASDSSSHSAFTLASIAVLTRSPDSGSRRAVISVSPGRVFRCLRRAQRVKVGVRGVAGGLVDGAGPPVELPLDSRGWQRSDRDERGLVVCSGGEPSRRRQRVCEQPRLRHRERSSLERGLDDVQPGEAFEHLRQLGSIAARHAKLGRQHGTIGDAAMAEQPNAKRLELRDEAFRSTRN